MKTIHPKTKKASEQRLPNIHPGKILLEEFMAPLSISQARLAEATGLPPSRVHDLVRQKRGITADGAMRLSKCFGVSAEFWLNLQSHYDLEEVRRAGSQAFDAIPLLNPAVVNAA